MAQSGLINLLAMIGIVYSIFVAFPIVIGMARFFVQNHFGVTQFETTFSGFRQNYFNGVGAMFVTDLFIGLWTLLFIIPGIIKGLEYSLVPFILADNPSMPGSRAREISRIMELGAIVCLPNSPPKCEVCPLSAICAARAQGIAEELPVKTTKKQRRIEEKTVFLIIHGGKAAIVKRPDKGLLAGLWEFPNTSGALSPQQAEELLKTQGISPLQLKRLPKAKHIFTHIEWHMTGYLVTVEETGEISNFIWANRAELMEQYTIPTAFKSYLERFLNL